MTETIHFQNLDLVQKQLRAMPVKALLALKAGLYREGETIMTASKRITPVAPDGGTLRASGFVEQPKVSKNAVTVELGFGGAAKAYALAVHEHPSKHSPPSWKNGVTWNVGGPKYLERPVNEAEQGFGKRVAKEMERRLV